MNKGQNFLKVISPVFINHLGFCKDKYVIEVGTGHGELTSILGSLAKKIVSIEFDKNLYDYSSKKFENCKNIKLMNSDFMQINLYNLVENEFGTFNKNDLVMCANIPYYITTPIIAKVLESQLFDRITLMIQKEVADKILTSPGTKNCSSLSVMVRYYSIPEFICDVPKYCFNPVPKVDSSVVSFKTIENSDIKNKKTFFNLVRASFLKRRKNILNSISSGMNLNKSVVNDVLNELQIDTNNRAENLTFKNFVDISNLIYSKVSEK